MVGVYFILKYFSKIKPITSNNNNLTSDAIRDGIKSAVQEIVYEKSPHEKKTGIPSYIYSTLQHDEPVKSDGDLIPYNLTEKEKTTLKMFYNND